MERNGKKGPFTCRAQECGDTWPVLLLILSIPCAQGDTGGLCWDRAVGRSHQRGGGGGADPALHPAGKGHCVAQQWPGSRMGQVFNHCRPFIPCVVYSLAMQMELGNTYVPARWVPEVCLCLPLPDCCIYLPKRNPGKPLSVL